MEIFKIKHDNGVCENVWEFVCESKGNRSGFKHECNLFLNGRFKTSAKCQYYNRTWECYTYQSVMYRAVGMLIEEHEDFLKEVFKNEHGYKQMTAKRKEEFAKMLESDNLMIELLAVKKKLDKRP